MRRRALQAMETNSHWSPMRTDEPHVTEAAHLAFWVAVTGTSGSGEEIIGSVGLRIVGDAGSATIDTADFSGLPSAGHRSTLGMLAKFAGCESHPNGAGAA